MLEFVLGTSDVWTFGSRTGLLVTAILLGPVAVNLALNLFRFRSRRVRAAGPRACASAGDARARPRMSILIPARNEEQNLPRLLDSLSRQTWSDMEVLVYDDGSEDGTWDVIRSRRNVTGVRGTGPPEGWYGKVHALNVLSERAGGDVFLFLDADTELRDERALERLVRRFEAGGGGLATGITRIRGKGHLLVSVIGFTILGSIPWWMGRRLPSRHMAAVNGQCWMIDAGLYERHRPHRAVRAEVLEDVMIGRYMYSRGVRPRLLNAQREVDVHMYTSFSDAWLGFRKNAYAMVGGTPASAFPLWTAYTTLYVVLPLTFAPALIASVLLKVMADRYLGVSPLISLAAPLSFVLAAVLILDSAVSTESGTARWKGRRLVSRSAGATGS